MNYTGIFQTIGSQQRVVRFGSGGFGLMKEETCECGALVKK